MAIRAEHRRVLALLELVDARFFREAECWFAGETAVSLRCDEYRISNDIDFLCATREGYRALRERVFDAGLRELFVRDIEVLREVRADRYGIRAVVNIEGHFRSDPAVPQGDKHSACSISSPPDGRACH